MSGGIEEPYTIAQLPKPFDTEKGRILAAPVHSIPSPRKRKRHEIAIAVDGESVNIYNVQRQTLTSSYALPPQSYLAAPPCSVYCKRAKPLQPQRQTYLAIRDGSRGEKSRLMGVVEDLGKPQSEEREPRVPAKRERKLRSGRVVGLDVLSAGENTDHPHSVLVTYGNGNVDCLSGDLSGARWEHTASLEENTEVEFTAVVDFVTARKGLLKGREDILALLDPATSGKPDTHAPPVLFQVVRSTMTKSTSSEGPSEESIRRYVCIFALRNTAGATLQGHRTALEELFRFEFQSYRSSGGRLHTSYELHPATGTLYQQRDGLLAMFDLSGTLPKLSFSLARKTSSPVISFARLSPATVLAVSTDRIVVYETKYGSVLSSLNIRNSITGATHATLGGQLEANSAFRIVSQFTDLGLVVAVSERNLFAFQIGDILDDGRHAKLQGPSLLDVLGKGKETGETQPPEPSAKQQKKIRRWEEWRAKVVHFVDHGDMQGLEEVVAKDLHIEVHLEPKQETNGLTNGHESSDDEHDAWNIPPPVYDPQNVEERKATYLLGKFFNWRTPNSPLERVEHQLELVLVSPNILRWLTLAGCLTTSRIEQVLWRSDLDAQIHIVPGDIVAAIQDADPSFRLLQDLMSLPVTWALEEVVRALQIFIRSFEAPEPEIWKGHVLEDAEPDTAMANGDDDDRLKAAFDATERQVLVAEAMLDDGQADRSEACRVVLKRLHAFPRTEVVQAMNALLSQDDLIFFMCVLRVELVDGGWTRLYVEGQADDEQQYHTGLDNVQEKAPINQAIRTIADLYCYAIDAIGLSGWLVGMTANLDDTTQLVLSMRNEIQAAIEGIFSMETLDNFLREVSKTAGAIEQQPPGQPLKRKRGFEDEAERAQAMMPVGGRQGPPQVKTWRTHDGRKSKVAIAEEKSRAVGKYSFERIRF